MMILDSGLLFWATLYISVGGAAGALNSAHSFTCIHRQVNCVCQSIIC